MLKLIINALGAVCSVMTVWYLIRAYLRSTQKNSQSDQVVIENYLQKITLIAGLSVYDTFCKSAEEWRVPADRIDRDFKIYLSSQSVPYYVKDFVRKGQKHIDELYGGKGTSFTDKKLLLFYSILTLVFWGGAVFVSLYVLPYVLPEEFRETLLLGPP
ncbi:MAG: hypothetical protein AB1Z29_13830 [Desulfobacterales bacterium]|jgi:hypothetical protein